MSIEDIKSSVKPYLTAADVAPVLGCDPHSIRVAAHQRPELLGFPVIVIGSRVKIPRIPFLIFLGEASI